MKKYIVALTLAAGIVFPAHAQKTASPEKIHWYSFEEAMALSEKKPKKIFVDLYTDWCGWCKQMDKTTFADSIIIRTMNKYYYAVKLNAERKDTVVYKGNKYINPSPGSARSTHQLAITLLQGQLGYPSFVFLNDKQDMITKVMGYRSNKELEVILKYYGENADKKKTLDQYKLDFKSEIP